MFEAMLRIHPSKLIANSDKVDPECTENIKSFISNFWNKIDKSQGKGQFPIQGNVTQDLKRIIDIFNNLPYGICKRE